MGPHVALDSMGATVAELCKGFLLQNVICYIKSIGSVLWWHA